MKLIALLAGLLIVSALPALAYASDDAHAGQTPVKFKDIPSPVWMTQAQLTGLPWWTVKVKCYSGETLQKEHEVQVLDGYTGYITDTTSRGSWNPYSGKFTPKTLLSFFVWADATQPGNSHPSLGDEAFQPVIDDTQSFSFGNLKLHVYCQDTDRFVAEIYAGHSPGYDLDAAQPIPNAVERAPVEPKLVGTVSGALEPRATPLYIELPKVNYIKSSADLVGYVPDGKGGLKTLEHTNAGSLESEGAPHE